MNCRLLLPSTFRLKAQHLFMNEYLHLFFVVYFINSMFSSAELFDTKYWFANLNKLLENMNKIRWNITLSMCFYSWDLFLYPENNPLSIVNNKMELFPTYFLTKTVDLPDKICDSITRFKACTAQTPWKFQRVKLNFHLVFSIFRSKSNAKKYTLTF